MSLQSLLNTGRLWRGANQRTDGQHTLSSGIQALDQLLLGGWPKAQVSELLYSGQGIGELRLLLPSLAALSQQSHTAWINPPFVPYPPALQDAGLALKHQLVVSPADHKQALWATEQTLKSGSCMAVIAWLEQQQEVASRDIRRLQLAAEQGQSQLWLMRPEQVAQQSSPSACRLVLTAISSHSIHVHCLKRRGSWAPPPISISLPDVSRSEQAHWFRATEQQCSGQLIQGPWQQRQSAH
ncbi:translesion DNA synthesis-associated protein ImuA [Neiella marina]|uniref:Translesion DNA synthesis-associated protein ImuA n=1 Tax=Neiella holothuriorum TaxID=2870530 RepID=A0ABS7EK23_9GAMM|nr:translesion DNA synthesis-associated protein ImuA [Neiella holothuriorum]MBW8192218.1 translesion DNA synthesis-associated protein ImuA [Neiella holothuriorum]